MAELQVLLRSVSEADFKLNSPEYWPAVFYNLPQQRTCITVSIPRSTTDSQSCLCVSMCVCVCWHVRMFVGTLVCPIQCV